VTLTLMVNVHGTAFTEKDCFRPSIESKPADRSVSGFSDFELW
jgi:hypothetical protein